MLRRPALVTPLRELKPFKTSWRIHVKLLHVWKQYTKNNGETIELILADESGDKIFGGVKKDQVKKFEKFLIEGSWKYITTMTLTPSSGMYKVSDIKYRIGLLHTTSVAPSDVVNSSMFLSLAKFDDILAGTLNQTLLVDVIGQVVDCEPIKEVLANGKNTKKIELNLRDKEDNRLACTLWGIFAEAIDQACKSSEDGVVLCLIRFVKQGLFKEIRSVSNAYDMSQLITDTNLPEFAEFRKILPADGLTMTVTDVKHKRVYVPKKIDKCLEYPRLTISELLAQRDVGKCRTICTVISIDMDWPWHYYACRTCKKKAIIEESIKLEDGTPTGKPKFWCEVCNKYTSSVMPKFWLHLNVSDQSGEAKCMLFDSFVQDIIGVTPFEILKGDFHEIEDPTVIPDEIKEICGKTLQFLLCHQRENVFGGSDIFMVGKVWTEDQLHELLLMEESDAYIDPNSIISGDQGSLMLTNGEDPSQLTPSSKRKSDSDDDLAQSSTNKKERHSVDDLVDSNGDKSNERAEQKLEGDQ